MEINLAGVRLNGGTNDCLSPEGRTAEADDILSGSHHRKAIGRKAEFWQAFKEKKASRASFLLEALK